MSLTIEFKTATIGYYKDTVKVWGVDPTEAPAEISFSDMVLFVEMASRYRNRKEGGTIKGGRE